MPDITIIQNIDVWCGTCGRGLCKVSSIDSARSAITVDACPYCMKEKDDRIAELEYRLNDLEYSHAWVADSKRRMMWEYLV